MVGVGVVEGHAGREAVEAGGEGGGGGEVLAGGGVLERCGRGKRGVSKTERGEDGGREGGGEGTKRRGEGTRESCMGKYVVYHARGGFGKKKRNRNRESAEDKSPHKRTGGRNPNGLLADGSPVPRG